WRRASRSTAWKTDGIDTVFALGGWPLGCARSITLAEPNPQGHQAKQCPCKFRDGAGLADRLWHRLAASTRAPVTRLARVHLGNPRLYGAGTDRPDEPLD